MLMTSSYFTTEAYPGNHRADAWIKTLAQFSLKPKRLDENNNLHASARWIVSPLGISFARLGSSPQEFSSGSETPKDGIWLALHIEGRARLRSSEGETILAPGDMCMAPLRADFGMCFDTDFQQFFVKIPKSVLDSRLMTLSTTFRVGSIPGRSGFGHVFAGMLGSIAETIDKLDANQFQPVEIALTEFLATCLVSEVSTSKLRGATATQMAILNRICQQIEARLGEHELSRDSIAEAEGISPRYVAEAVRECRGAICALSASAPAGALPVRACQPALCTSLDHGHLLPLGLQRSRPFQPRVPRTIWHLAPRLSQDRRRGGLAEHDAADAGAAGRNPPRSSCRWDVDEKPHQMYARASRSCAVPRCCHQRNSSRMRRREAAGKSREPPVPKGTITFQPTTRRCIAGFQQGAGRRLLPSIRRRAYHRDADPPRQ